MFPERETTSFPYWRPERNKKPPSSAGGYADEAIQQGAQLARKSIWLLSRGGTVDYDYITTKSGILLQA
jgi:hypothetical protein